MHLFFGKDIGSNGIKAGLRVILHGLNDIASNDRVCFFPEQEGGNVARAVIPPSVTIEPFGAGYIFLSPRFFSCAPELQSLVMIHESSHLFLNSEDKYLKKGYIAYGWNEAIQLASEDPRVAIKNADNWANFIVGHALGN
jgi:hypothetical protein